MVPEGDFDLLRFNSLALGGTLLFDIFRCWPLVVGIVNAAFWVGANLDDLATPPAIHDDGFRHAPARFLCRTGWARLTVLARCLALQFDVTIAPQRGIGTVAVSRRDLYQFPAYAPWSARHGH